MSDSWTKRRVVVTVGRGFLEPYVVEKLRSRGAQHVFAPAQTDYDLQQMEAVERMYRDLRSRP